MKVIFRCDSSFKIGHGHLIRCLNLAKRLDLETTFICRTLPENVNSKVLDYQFKLVEISPSESDLELIKEYQPELLIADSYDLDINWERSVRNYCKKLVIIDDLKRKHDCDAVIDQNFRSNYDDIYDTKTLFLGPKYTLINKSFLNIKHNPVDPKRVIIFFGGSDPAGITLKLVELLSRSGQFEYNLDIIAGKSNSNLGDLQKITDLNQSMRLHIDIDYMPELMCKASVFVGAGGSTTWERAIIGLPSIVVSIADNQEEISRDLNEAGIIKYLGRHQDIKNEDVLSCTKSLLVNTVEYEKLKNNSLRLHVGEGLEELISYLKS